MRLLALVYARDAATIGGMVATNAGGVNVLRHGPMRRQVGGFSSLADLGMTLELDAAVVEDLRGRVVFL